MINLLDKIHVRFDSDSEEEPLSQSHKEEEQQPEPQPHKEKEEQQLHKGEEQQQLEPEPEPQPIIEAEKPVESLPYVNGSNSSVRIHYIPSSVFSDVVEKPEEPKVQKKTIDLLFEMKQHKSPNEKQGKKIQQQFNKKRAQHRKRALDYFSMANFVDQAFGLSKEDLEKQISLNGYDTSSSPPQVNIY